MKRKSKYQRRKQKSRDCRDCNKFGGFIGKNYFKCKIYEDGEDFDIYDRDVLTKGTCYLFVPLEVDQDDSIHVNDAVERMQQEDAADLLHKE